MELFDAEDVVMKLIGPVKAVGETNADTSRLVNLNNLTVLVDRLIAVIEDAAEDASRPEASMKKIGQRAREYLDELRDGDKNEAL